MARIGKEFDAAVGAAGGLEAVPRLVEALYHRKEEVRQAAAWSLGEIAHESGVPALLAALHDPDWVVRRNAVAALVKIGRADVVGRLLPLLQDPVPYVRAEAAHALGVLGTPPEALPALQALLDDDGFCYAGKFKGCYVREVAAVVLAGLRNNQG